MTASPLKNGAMAGLHLQTGLICSQGTLLVFIANFCRHADQVSTGVVGSVMESLDILLSEAEVNGGLCMQIGGVKDWY